MNHIAGVDKNNKGEAGKDFCGDGLSALVSLWIVSEAHRLGAGSGTLARMLINVGVDTTIGAIPLAGDLFDIGWKTNQRNVRLLAQDLRTTDGPEVDHRP